MTLVLHHFGASTASGRVRLALAEKGLAYTSRHINLKLGEQRSAEFLKLNPAGMVPVLVHDGQVLTEASVISEYLEEALPGPALVPQSPGLRARMRLWMRRIDGGLHDPGIVVLTHALGRLAEHRAALAAGMSWEERLRFVSDPARRRRIREAVEQGPEGAAVAAALADWSQLMLELEQSLEHGGWLLGVQFSLADIAYVPYFLRLQQLGLSRLWAGLGPVEDWWQRVQSRPSFRPGLYAWLDAEERAALRP